MKLQEIVNPTIIKKIINQEIDNIIKPIEEKIKKKQSKVTKEVNIETNKLKSLFSTAKSRKLLKEQEETFKEYIKKYLPKK